MKVMESVRPAKERFPDNIFVKEISYREGFVIIDGDISELEEMSQTSPCEKEERLRAKIAGAERRIGCKIEKAFRDREYFNNLNLLGTYIEKRLGIKPMDNLLLVKDLLGVLNSTQKQSNSMFRCDYDSVGNIQEIFLDDFNPLVGYDMKIGILNKKKRFEIYDLDLLLNDGDDIEVGEFLREYGENLKGLVCQEAIA